LNNYVAKSDINSYFPPKIIDFVIDQSDIMDIDDNNDKQSHKDKAIVRGDSMTIECRSVIDNNKILQIIHIHMFDTYQVMLRCQ
jgi:hypothetical protein